MTRLQNPESHTVSGWMDRATELDVEVGRLTRERDEARAEVERWKDAADDMVGSIERVFQLRVLLRELEWVEVAGTPSPACVFCDGNPEDGHTPDCPLAAALAGQ